MRANGGSEHRAPGGRRLLLLALGALGVVFGDIGTSPLYAFRECFGHTTELPLTSANVLGILSLIFWSLMIIVTVKYLVSIMEADNNGEGGILALLTLVRSRTPPTDRLRTTLIVLGLFGSALLYGDGILTPAISILSAVEGLEVATPAFRPYIIPIAVVLLVGLFAFQRRGTGFVGFTFGPVTLAWFVTLAALGTSWIVEKPDVMLAIDPRHAFRFMLREGREAFLALGGVFLAVTGAEALYADMGHFGKRPIRVAWGVAVLPALVLNYFGQGALLLSRPDAIDNPFYHLAPQWALYPLVVIATAATVVASQAVISGAFSLTNQALQLDYFPRLDVRHTSAHEIGQVYVPFVNWTLLGATLLLVIGFESSTALAGAYGVAVAATMVITSILAYFCARRVWAWSAVAAVAVWGAFLLVDGTFLAANLAKVAEGGWVPLFVAAFVFAVMTTWRQGRNVLTAHFAPASIPYEMLIADLERHKIARVPGTAVYMDRHGESVPRTLFHNLKHNMVVHDNVVVLTIVTEDVPRVRKSKRLEVKDFGHGFKRLIAHQGYMEMLNVPDILRAAKSAGIEYDPMKTTFVLGHETLIPAGKQLPRWRARLFGFMSRNSQRATKHYGIPPNRVIEIGSQVDL
jgi:KUP system potassium uptake protein